MISAPGVGSGLDVNSIVDQLMALERRPLNRLESDKRGLEAQLSAFGKLKSALGTFQSALSDLKTLDAFEVYSAVSGNEAAFTASADSKASEGFVDIQVVNLAEAHKLGSAAFADTDTTTIGGAGDQMTLTVNGQAFTVAAGGQTLEGIRDAINNAPDNTGVSATIIRENSGSNRLVLTSTATGTANAINLTFTGSVGTALNLTDLNAAEDAQILVDGAYTITRASNSISDAIDGITLNLLAETTTAATLTVSRDTESVQESVQAFVDAYNEVRSVIDELKGSDLDADSTVRSIENRLSTIFSQPPSGITSSFSYLSEVGVSLQRDGTLKLDSTALGKAIDTDFNGFAQLFANDDQGYLFRLDSAVAGFIQSDGLIDIREDGINSNIDRVETRIGDMEYRLTLTEQRLRDKFTALDTLMGELQGTSQFLFQQLSALPTPGKQG
ncbi:MAG TPA: flagellar cap protein [Gammaproteobacteria bacterium]|nr:flagellar cap protein [Gammaproteobacteria bacterium]